MFLGSIFTILVVSGPCYFITKFIINNYKKNKIKLLNKKVKE